MISPLAFHYMRTKKSVKTKKKLPAKAESFLVAREGFERRTAVRRTMMSPLARRLRGNRSGMTMVRGRTPPYCKRRQKEKALNRS